MKNNWFITSFISGILAGIIGYIYIPIFKFAMGITVVVTVIMLLYNPKRWMRRLSIILLTAWLFQIDKVIEIVSDVFNMKLQFTGNRWSKTESVILLILFGISFILDWLERNEKINLKLFSSNKNIVKDITGNNVTINQNLNEKD